MADKIKKWIKNRNNLENLIEEIFVTSQKIATDLIEQERKLDVEKM